MSDIKAKEFKHTNGKSTEESILEQVGAYFGPEVLDVSPAVKEPFAKAVREIVDREFAAAANTPAASHDLQILERLLSVVDDIAFDRDETREAEDQVAAIQTLLRVARRLCPERFAPE